MNLYKVPVELLIWADTPKAAAAAAVEELDYLCGLDNTLAGADITPDEGVTLEEKGDDTE